MPGLARGSLGGGGACSLNPNPWDESHGAYPSNMRASGPEHLTLLSRRDKLQAIRLMSSRHGLVMVTIVRMRPAKPSWICFADPLLSLAYGVRYECMRPRLLVPGGRKARGD